MPASALLASAKLFREEKKIPCANLAVSSEHGQQLITLVTSTFRLPATRRVCACSSKASWQMAETTGQRNYFESLF
jgi:hypothetical protein